MTMRILRRSLLKLPLAAIAPWPVALETPFSFAAAKGQIDYASVRNRCREFIFGCRRKDGGFSASLDPSYGGNSDTRASDLAAVTYAVVLAKTMGWRFPDEEQIVRFVKDHQKPDGTFVNFEGGFDPGDPLALLYNTTQGVVALRALGTQPERDPVPPLEKLFGDLDFSILPLYTTSFFPLLYAALGRPFPRRFETAISEYMRGLQGEDGYLHDHVAATFHMAHFFRLVGRPTPRSEAMLDRTLEDQTEQGGWNIKEPDWDVHACFDAVFILRQLGEGRADCREATEKAARWAASCQNEDGGFGHFPGWHSDMDAVYFQLGTLIQAEKAPGARYDLPDAHTLGWGHAMRPDRDYGI